MSNTHKNNTTPKHSKRSVAVNARKAFKLNKEEQQLLKHYRELRSDNPESKPLLQAMVVTYLRSSGLLDGLLDVTTHAKASYLNLLELNFEHCFSEVLAMIVYSKKWRKLHDQEYRDYIWAFMHEMQKLYQSTERMHTSGFIGLVEPYVKASFAN